MGLSIKLLELIEHIQGGTDLTVSFRVLGKVRRRLALLDRLACSAFLRRFTFPGVRNVSRDPDLSCKVRMSYGICRRNVDTCTGFLRCRIGYRPIHNKFLVCGSTWNQSGVKCQFTRVRSRLLDESFRIQGRTAED